MKKKIFLVILAVALLCASILPALANTIDEKKEELDSVYDNIKERKDDLIQNKQAQEKVKKEIELLNNEMEVLRAQIRNYSSKIKTTEGEITVVEGELAEAEENIVHMDETLAIRLRAIHEHGKVSYLDVLFESTSFADFLTRYNDLRQVINEDKVLLTEHKEQREHIHSLKVSLEERRQDLLAMRRDLQSKEREVDIKKAKQQKLVAMLEEEYRNTNNEISKLEAEAKKIQEIIKQLQRAQSGNARGTGILQWPVPEYGTGWITSYYGYRRDPISGRRGVFHGGIDIGIPRNRWPAAKNYTRDPVQVVAADAGVAYTYRMGSGYGNLVIVDHGNNVATVYAHNHNFLVENNTPVYKGQPIAIVGSTGYSTGPHLHFEVRINGERVNPLSYVK